MADHIFLWYGEDTFLLQQKLTAWRERFAQKSDVMLDMQEIDVSDTNYDALQQAVSLLPLFGDKRLVIVRGALTQTKTATQEKVVSLLEHIHENIVVLFLEEGTVKADSELFVALKECYSSHYFPAPTESTLKKRTVQRLQQLQCEIDTDALDLLVKRVGADYERLQNEVEKLELACASRRIERALVEEMIVFAPESRIFALTDAIFRNNPARAFSLLDAELAFGTSPIQIIALLAGTIRRAIAVLDCTERGQSVSDNPLLKSIKPFAISKARQITNRASMTQLVNYLTLLAWADYQCKTGAEPLPVLLSLTHFT